ATYTFIVSNGANASSASSVIVADTLPSGLGFVSATPSTGTCSNAAGAITCALGTLAPGAVATVTVVASTTAGVHVNQGTVTANETDPSPGNNSASVSTAVAAPGETDLSLADVGAPTTPVATGSTVTYTLTVANNGPLAATGATLTDTFPNGFVIA